MLGCGLISMAEVDTDVLRRILFAVEYLPTECPGYWEVIATFASLESASNVLSSEDVKVFVDNLQLLNERAFATDASLRKELHDMSHGEAVPLGVVLVSKNSVCQECGGKLLIRSDRPSRVIIYTESQGTVLGSHYQKFCQNYRKGCSYTQHYGYYCKGTNSPSYYDSNWDELKFSCLLLRLHLSCNY